MGMVREASGRQVKVQAYNSQANCQRNMTPHMMNVNPAGVTCESKEK